MQRQSIPVDSNATLDELKDGDKLYTVELQVNDGVGEFSCSKLTFKKYLNDKTHIEGINTSEDSILAELETDKGLTVKTDISVGFFLTEYESVVEFTRGYEQTWEFVKAAHDLYMKDVASYSLEHTS